MACDGRLDRYGVLVVGAGKIGASFDTPQHEAVLTHAHAFHKHPGFALKGFVDADPRLAAEAAALWGGDAFGSLAEALGSQPIEVVVLAVPDEFHYQLLEEIAQFPVRLVFAEKPLAKSLAQAQAIVSLYREQGIALAVNYTRRFMPEFAELRAQIARGDFGRYLAGTGYYGKGTLHNGSHMIDLLRFLVGEPARPATLARICDWREDDPTCTASLRVAQGLFLLQAVTCQSYTIFEMDLLFERARVRLLDSGFSIESSTVHDSELFAGYRVLGGAVSRATSQKGALYHAACNLHEHLSAGRPLECSGEDGLRALELCAEIVGAAP